MDSRGPGTLIHSWPTCKKIYNSTIHDCCSHLQLLAKELELAKILSLVMRWMMGLGECDMGSEFKSGKMAPNIKANGRIIKLMERAPSGTLMVTFMKASSKMINQTATVSFTAPIAPFMKVHGSMISSMDQDRHTGLTAQATSEIIRRVDVMVSAPTNGRMATHTAVNGLTMP